MSTVALIERRPDISRDLFTRYWRDVHGVMAARIPGFESYTQFHVTPVGDDAPPFEGIAIVTFASEADREGLATSEVTRHIHRDEQNVFRRALLYNLGHDGRAISGPGDRTGAHALFVVVGHGADCSTVSARLAASAPIFCDTYDLTEGDPGAWNDTDTAGDRFTALIHAGWSDSRSRDGAERDVQGHASGSFKIDEVRVMVDRGAPTPIGLRGLDAVRTILEAGADNQLADEVAAAIYGPIAAPRAPVAEE